MNQMQTFIEQAKKDKDLMAKLDALGASGAETDKIIALAARIRLFHHRGRLPGSK